MNRSTLPSLAMALGLLATGSPSVGSPQPEPDLPREIPVNRHPVTGISSSSELPEAFKRTTLPSTFEKTTLPAARLDPSPPTSADNRVRPKPFPLPQDSAPSREVPKVIAPPSTGKNQYVDRNDYGGGRTNLPPLLPPAVELTERSTGCRTTLVRGHLVSATCRAQKQLPQPSPSGLGLLAPEGTLPAPTAPPAFSVLGAPIAVDLLPKVAIDGKTSDSAPVASSVARSPGVPAELPPPPAAPAKQRFNPANYVKSALSSATRAISRHRPRLKLPGNGDRGVLYPLAMPGRISSIFGWRIHPIFGNRRFHSGTDIAAPQGTPVLAAYSGRVWTASSLQGYGLTVILRHADNTQESRYAHLSEILVRPGEWVEQGTEIGRVGSTGNSTGPHLHFEWRQLEGSQWVAVDAGEHLQANAAVSLAAYRQPGPHDTSLATEVVGARASWYVTPAMPAEGKFARPIAQSLWRYAERSEADTGASWRASSPYALLLSWLRWRVPSFPVLGLVDRTEVPGPITKRP